ncbi:Phosphatidate cytidylyltransferase [plant metagenome]|uniref:Phosphatidate cytidylyltransferase n=2 Tax=root TaxID=1 RepID=A0A1C3JXC0_9BURK|nr:phosphatidate cytidylyltransferase [Orrella dioscoreae]SBT23870.1 Phosphatidate cytidylyltransferase [Orrella dioscoreae]SOE49605.1 Phosphatidate cytidylyltransferase [Orrella dioscoreae]
MLRTRIVTAVVLLALIAAALASGSIWPLLVLLSVATGCALWEWLRLTAPGRDAAAVAAGIAMGLLTLGCAWLWQSPTADLSARLTVYAITTRLFVPVVAGIWLFAGTLAVVRGQVEQAPRSILWSLFAIPALYCAWAALALFYMTHGALYLVSMMAVVWVADIGAYFAGRAFGRRKLAPRVSPGKSWEGAIAGAVLVAVYVGACSQWPGTFGHDLAQRWGVPAALAFALLLAALSVMGDLFESLLKRRAGVKDSGSLLPGHGGVYDRIDALVPVAPVALLLSGVVT